MSINRLAYCSERLPKKESATEDLFEEAMELTQIGIHVTLSTNLKTQQRFLLECRLNHGTADKAVDILLITFTRRGIASLLSYSGERIEQLDTEWQSRVPGSMLSSIARDFWSALMHPSKAASRKIQRECDRFLSDDELLHKLGSSRMTRELLQMAADRPAWND